MNQLATLLGILASAPERQLALLPGLPRDPSVADCYTNRERNPLLALVIGFNEFFSHRDTESRLDYLERLGLPSDYDPRRSSIDELEYVLWPLRPEQAQLWTQQALERKPLWRLARRLAQVVRSENGWLDDVTVEDATTLARHCSALLIKHWRENGRPWDYSDPE